MDWKPEIKSLFRSQRQHQTHLQQLKREMRQKEANVPTVPIGTRTPHHRARTAVAVPATLPPVAPAGAEGAGDRARPSLRERLRQIDVR